MIKTKSFFIYSLLFLFACSSATVKSEARSAAARNWLENCAACHGQEGNPPSAWADKGMRKFGTMGMSMGFFFGGDKMRAGIARTIREGKGALMPSFKDKFSDQEITDLVKYIEEL